MLVFHVGKAFVPFADIARWNGLLESFHSVLLEQRNTRTPFWPYWRIAWFDVFDQGVPDLLPANLADHPNDGVAHVFGVHLFRVLGKPSMLVLTQK